MEVHILNVGCGNAAVIRTASSTYLVDCNEIENHSHLLPSSKAIRALFITHQNRDHTSGMQYLRDHRYKIDFLVCSPYVRRYGDPSVTIEEWNDFDSHRTYFEGQGAKLYTPYRQQSFDKPWWQTDGLSVWMLGPFKHLADSETRHIHDACLVLKVNDSRKVLFPGDASEASLQAIADNTTHTCDDILIAAHHGSLEGANTDFIKKASPQFTVISTKAGVYPNVPHPTALQRYQANTSQTVYRTDKEGSLKFT